MDLSAKKVTTIQRLRSNLFEPKTLKIWHIIIFLNTKPNLIDFFQILYVHFPLRPVSLGIIHIAL